MDAKVIIENLLSAIENGDKDDIEETVTLAKLMLPGLSAPPAMTDLTGKWAVLNFDTGLVIGVFDDQATADSTANGIAARSGEDLQVYEIKISAQVVQPKVVQVPPQSATPASTPAAATCPDCFGPLDASGDCPDTSCSSSPHYSYVPPGYVKTEGKHRPGSGLANKSLYSGGSGSNDTGVLR